MNTNNNVKITIRMQTDLKEQIKLLAKRNHISMNEQMLEMLGYACTQKNDNDSQVNELKEESGY